MTIEEKYPDIWEPANESIATTTKLQTIHKDQLAEANKLIVATTKL